MADNFKLYRQNVLDGFPNGCLLDLRVRLAVDFLKAGTIAGDITPADAVAYALDLATELLAVAESRGLVEPLPDDDGLPAPVRKQAGRIARFNIEQQVAGNRMAREQQSGVVMPFGPPAKTN